MSKFTFDDVIERLNDQRSVDAKDVRADALRRMVWVAEWHIPGCLSESWAVCLTKEDAIRCALDWADCDDGAPRGMVTALRRSGRFDSHSDMFGTCVNTIERTTIGGIL